MSPAETRPLRTLSMEERIDRVKGIAQDAVTLDVMLRIATKSHDITIHNITNELMATVEAWIYAHCALNAYVYDLKNGISEDHHRKGLQVRPR